MEETGKREQTCDEKKKHEEDVKNRSKAQMKEKESQEEPQAEVLMREEEKNKQSEVALNRGTQREGTEARRGAVKNAG